MKQVLINALEFPRRVIQDHVAAKACAHEGRYADDPSCRLCAAAIQCQWLCHHDEFSGLALKSDQEVALALAFATDFVEASVAADEHDCNTCGCEVCCWLRESQEMLADFQLELPVSTP